MRESIIPCFFSSHLSDLHSFASPQTLQTSLSRRKQVLFLDADNVAVADPTPLFQAPAFQDTGTLLWPDYWASTAAPDLAAVLGLGALPAGTHESGQMLFSKRRCVPAAARTLKIKQLCLVLHVLL